MRARDGSVHDTINDSWVLKVSTLVKQRAVRVPTIPLGWIGFFFSCVLPLRPILFSGTWKLLSSIPDATWHQQNRGRRFLWNSCENPPFQTGPQHTEFETLGLRPSLPKKGHWQRHICSSIVLSVWALLENVIGSSKRSSTWDLSPPNSHSQPVRRQPTRAASRST